MEFNWLGIGLATIVPMILGMIYYNPKVVGGAWIKSTGKTEAQLTDGMNMPLVAGLGLVLSFLMAMFLAMFLMGSHKGAVDGTHWFGHGAFHGFFVGLFVSAPVLIQSAMYERRTWANTMIHVIFWLIAISLMGGIIDAFI